MTEKNKNRKICLRFFYNHLLFQRKFPDMRLLFIIVLCTITVATIHSEETVFNSQRAFEILKSICAFGPRVPGTQGHNKTLQYLTTEMKKLGYVVYHQQFDVQPVLLKKRVTLTNIIAYTDLPTTDTVIALSSHWDTRPIAERDPNPSLRNIPILGANDGASGNAVMLEVARIAQNKGFARNLVLIFFDGEDLGTTQRLDEYCLGSRYLSRNMPEFLSFDFGINLDMVGDKDLEFRIEPFSYESAPKIVEEIWSIGEKKYPAHFSRAFWNKIIDDHYPFVTQGKPYIDIIDFDYEWWHTQQDTPEQCSERSLRVIGETIVKYLFLKLKIDKNFS